MIALDASVLIAHLTSTDAHHSAATGLLVEAEPGSLLVHPITMAEVLVGAVRVGRANLLREDLRRAGMTVVVLDADAPLRWAELRATTRLKLPDCCVLDLALHHRASLATFDSTLAAAARERGIALAW